MRRELRRSLGDALTASVEAMWHWYRLVGLVLLWPFAPKEPEGAELPPYGRPEYLEALRSDPAHENFTIRSGRPGA